MGAGGAQGGDSRGENRVSTGYSQQLQSTLEVESESAVPWALPGMPFVATVLPGGLLCPVSYPYTGT